ncbi:hypothetical protein RKD18_003814 [Streptomyces phaeoluteigriseus]
MVGGLLLVPAEAEAEGEAAAGEVVNGRDPLGEVDRIVLGDEGDAGAEAEVLRHGRRLSEGDEGVEGTAVLAGQVAARGIRGGALDGDVRVFGEVEPGEAALLQLAGEAGRGDRLVGEEDGDGDAHGAAFRLGRLWLCDWAAAGVGLLLGLAAGPPAGGGGGLGGFRGWAALSTWVPSSSVPGSGPRVHTDRSACEGDVSPVLRT